jgi:hypothetical protein
MLLFEGLWGFAREVAFGMVVLGLMLKVVYFPECIDVLDLHIRLEACCDLRLPS